MPEPPKASPPSSDDPAAEATGTAPAPVAGPDRGSGAPPAGPPPATPPAEPEAIPPGLFGGMDDLAEVAGDPAAGPPRGPPGGRREGAAAPAGRGRSPTLTVPDRPPAARGGQQAAPRPAADRPVQLPAAVAAPPLLPPWWPVPAALAVVAAAVAALVLYVVSTRPVAVFVADIDAIHHHPILSPGGALVVRPRAELTQAFKVGGQLAGPLPAVGGRVKAGEVLARLRLGPQVERGLAQARAAVAGSQGPLVRARSDVQHFDGLLEAAAAQVRAHAPPGRDHAHPSGALRRAKERLHHLRGRYAIPQARLARAAEVHAAARARLARLEAQTAGTLLSAPSAGRIAAVHDPGGGPVVAGRPVLTLVDDSAVRLTFRLEDLRGLSPGHEARVMVGEEEARVGRVVAVQEVAGSFEVTAELPCHAGDLLGLPPERFRLVWTFVETAFTVRASAVMGSEQHASVWWLSGGGLVRQPVHVLASAGDGELILFDATGRLPERARIVTGRLDGQPLASLGQDSRLAAQLEHRPPPRRPPAATGH